MVVTQTSLRHPVSHHGRMVVLVTPEYEGVHQQIGGLGKVAKDIAQRGREIGIRYVVVVPYVHSASGRNELEDIPWQRKTKDLYFNYYYGRFNDVPVFSVGLEFPFPERFPLGGTPALRAIHEFGRALLHLTSSQRLFTQPGALFHFFDYPMGTAISPEYRKHYKVLFSPMDPKFDHRYKLSDPTILTGLKALPHLGAEDDRGLSGLEVGAALSDGVIFWSQGHYNKFSSAETYNLFMQLCQDKKHVLPGSWLPWLGQEITEDTLRGINDAYMRVLYNDGLKRSLHFIQNPDMFIDRAYILVPEPSNPNLPSRTEAAKAAIARANLEKEFTKEVVVFGSGRNGVFNDYWQNAGGLVTLLEQVLGDPHLNPMGRYVIIPDGGYFERGGPLTQAVGMEGIKGLVQDGQYTLSINCVRQAPTFFRQLPNHGYGWIVFSASDNRWIPAGTPKVGKHNLWETKKGIVLTGQPKKFNLELEDEKLDEELASVQSLGWFITDGNGEISVFAEKTPPHLIRGVLREKDVDTLIKNSFVFAMTIDTARVMVEKLLKTNTLKDPKKPYVSVYPIDISSHIFFPMTVERADWELIFDVMQKLRAKETLTPDEEEVLTTTGLSILEIAKGMLKFEYIDTNYRIVFDHKEDWMKIWNFAQAAKKVAGGGIAGANIGKESIWDDFGTLSTITQLWQRHFDEDQTIREISRMLGGLPTDTNVKNVTGLKNVTFVDPESGKALPPGQVPQDVIIVNTTFNHPVKIIGRKVIVYGAELGAGIKEIPAHTIIVGGKIETMEEALDQPAETKNLPRLLINCFPKGKLVTYAGMLHTSLSLRFADPAKLSSLGLKPEDRPVALVPIFVNLKDPIAKARPYVQKHPALSILDPKRNLIEQSFVVEDENGNLKLLGMNFWDVRGGRD